MFFRIRVINVYLLLLGVLLMAEMPVSDKFFPMLIKCYIRLMVVVRCIQNEADGKEYLPVPVKFKIARDYYQQMINSEIDSPFFGLTLAYDDNAEILTVTPDDFVLQWYTNKIMREVALKQAEDFKVRYSNFITLLP